MRFRKHGTGTSLLLVLTGNAVHRVTASHFVFSPPTALKQNMKRICPYTNKPLLEQFIEHFSGIFCKQFMFAACLQCRYDLLCIGIEVSNKTPKASYVLRSI